MIKCVALASITNWGVFPEKKVKGTSDLQGNGTWNIIPKLYKMFDFFKGKKK